MSKGTLIAVIVIIIVAIIAAAVLLFVFKDKITTTTSSNEQKISEEYDMTGRVLSPDGTFSIYVSDITDKVTVITNEDSLTEAPKFTYCLESADKSYEDYLENCGKGKITLFEIIIYNQNQLEEAKEYPLFESLNQIFKEQNSLNYSFCQPAGIVPEEAPSSGNFYTEVMDSIVIHK
ncbi:MAG: hypothetical protein HQ530_05110 [Parcubacteria group bacterium]|nr:hypothetical protein [Parcubacteria group bacterium]